MVLIAIPIFCPKFPTILASSNHCELFLEPRHHSCNFNPGGCGWKTISPVRCVKGVGSGPKHGGSNPSPLWHNMETLRWSSSCGESVK